MIYFILVQLKYPYITESTFRSYAILHLFCAEWYGICYIKILLANLWYSVVDDSISISLCSPLSFYIARIFPNILFLYQIGLFIFAAKFGMNLLLLFTRCSIEEHESFSKITKLPWGSITIIFSNNPKNSFFFNFIYFQLFFL